MQGQGGAQRHLVIGTKNGAETLPNLQQPFNRSQTAVFKKGAGHHQQGVHFEAGQFMCDVVSTQPLVGIWMRKITRDEGNVAMAQIQQMLCRQTRAFEVVEVQRRQVRGLQGSPRHHHGQGLGAGT